METRRASRLRYRLTRHTLASICNHMQALQAHNQLARGAHLACSASTNFARA